MDARSEATLAMVHRDLALVIRRAFEDSPVKFQVIAGLRTAADELLNCKHGASETTHSRHLAGVGGLACAVDIMALKADGSADWSSVPYAKIATAVMTASIDSQIPVEWGGNWKTLKDFGHFQLPWASYP